MTIFNLLSSLLLLIELCNGFTFPRVLNQKENRCKNLKMFEENLENFDFNSTENDEGERMIRKLISDNFKGVNVSDVGTSPDSEIEDELESELEKNLKQMQGFIPMGVRVIYNKNDENMRRMVTEGAQNGLGFGARKKKKSENFEVIDDVGLNFTDVGGYQNIKEELLQCSDLLQNHTKYSKYNVRVPKGLILEGPPGNGKTLLAKAFSGETNSSYIYVSGSQFQEKYVGIGPARIRELFELADNNVPCIIFIDEVDALGRKRSSDGESSSAERDNTLNELLVKLDGFKKFNGVFIIMATNRIDLLDDALLRPGRIDKKIFVGNPDGKTRERIINIHLEGKPHDKSVKIDKLVDLTNGMSGADIENFLNEAMLYALRDNREIMTMKDLDFVSNRMIGGWQPNANVYSDDMIKRIAVHELGHALTGYFMKEHSRLSRINLNANSPKSPGYTVFEIDEMDANIYTKEKLFSHLVVLLSGRIAEEVFFGTSVTTGASKDLEEAYKLSEQMIIRYGMGKETIFPTSSDKSKELIDDEISILTKAATEKSTYILNSCKELIEELYPILIDDGILTRDQIEMKIYRRYPHLLNIDQ